METYINSYDDIYALSEAVLGLERMFYQVSESVGVVEVCVVVLQLNTNCPISFSYFTSNDGSAGYYIYTYILQ